MIFQRTKKYRPIGRKILLNKRASLKDVPNGLRCEREICSTAYVISRKGGVPDRRIEKQEVLVPFFKIASNPQVRDSEGISVKRLEKASLQSLDKTEDTEIFKDLDSAMRTNQNVECSGGLTIAALNYCFSIINSHDLDVDKIAMHPRQYAEMLLLEDYKKGFLFKLKHFLFNINGTLWDAKIYVSHRIKEGNVYFFPKSKFIGVLASTKIKKEIGDVPDWKSRVFSKMLSIAIINDHTIARLQTNRKIEVSEEDIKRADETIKNCKDPRA